MGRSLFEASLEWNWSSDRKGGCSMISRDFGTPLFPWPFSIWKKCGVWLNWYSCACIISVIVECFRLFIWYEHLLYCQNWVCTWEFRTAWKGYCTCSNSSAILLIFSGEIGPKDICSLLFLRHFNSKPPSVAEAVGKYHLPPERDAKRWRKKGDSLFHDSEIWQGQDWQEPQWKSFRTT